MKRTWIHAGAAILVVAAIAGVVVVVNNSKDHSDTIVVLSNSTAKQKINAKPKQACLVFSLEDAKQILGDGAKAGENGTDTSSNDLEVSTCSYSLVAAAEPSNPKSATLLVRAPKTSEGLTSNANQFGRLKPGDVQDVRGYGDAAYWDPSYGQLNIFKNNTWYIVSYGPVTPASRTLEQTKQLADILVNKM